MATKRKFEEAVAQLEEIIDQIESGDIGLEESIGQYEKGTKLIEHCQTILNRAQKRISQLSPPPAPGPEAPPESSSNLPGGSGESSQESDSY